MFARQQAIAILTERSQGAPRSKHCRAVADSALVIGTTLERHGAVDRSFLWSAALLYDFGRHVSHGPVRHGVEGYELLSASGHQKEARVCFFRERLERAFASAGSCMALLEQDIGESIERMVALPEPRF
jgi:HD superfamily phosphodiesterase